MHENLRKFIQDLADTLKVPKEAVQFKLDVVFDGTIPRVFTEYYLIDDPLVKIESIEEINSQIVPKGLTDEQKIDVLSMITEVFQELESYGISPFDIDDRYTLRTCLLEIKKKYDRRDQTDG